jgi:hypothetical protein
MDSRHSTPLTVAESANHVTGAFAVVLDDLTAVGLRIQDVALLVGVLEVVDVLVEVVVVVNRSRCCSSRRAVRTTGAVGRTRHGPLKARGNTVRLLAEALGLAQGLTPAHTSRAVVVLVDVHGHVNLDEARVLLDAHLGGPVVVGLRQRLVGRAVEVLQHIELLLGHVPGDVHVVLGDHGVVVVVVEVVHGG